MRGKKLNLEHTCQKLKIDLDCLLYFFRKKFYNIENEQTAITQKDFGRLKRYRSNNVISVFFLENGYKVLTENGVLTTKPKPKIN